MEYRSVVGETVVERVIEKSRFIAFVAHAEGEEAARGFLARVRALHPEATHVCYGFVADRVGNLQRFSDDGEPSGTAGIPILGAIKAQDLKETAVAVVRYFGGIKLGAGGLLRAYAGVAAEGLRSAEQRRYETCVEITLAVRYSDVNAALRFLEGEEVLSRTFLEGANFTVAVREGEEQAFFARANDYFNGTARLETGKRYEYPFPPRNGA